MDYYKKNKNKNGKIDFDNVPAIIRKETNDYIEGEDFIARSFDNLFEVIPPAEILNKSSVYLSFKLVFDNLNNDTEFRRKTVKRSVMKQWIYDKYGKTSIEIHKKTDHLVNFRWKVPDVEEKVPDVEEKNIVVQAAGGASMADAETISMTDNNGIKHTLERKAPKAPK